jgi:D-3-phosphoglycerate dehydrogenase / 2-oxoglutarate reductase
MANFKVYITDFDYPDNEIEKSILEPIGAEVIGLQCKDGRELEVLARDANALMVQYAKVRRSAIESMSDLIVIARYGIGMDIVDAKAAADHGIICTNVPDYCSDEVADHNIALILMLARQIPVFVSETKLGKWHWSETGRPVHRFKDLTVGSIAFGRIAQNMCRKLKAFGFNIIVYDPHLDQGKAREIGVRSVDLETLLRESDVVCLQCPYLPETHHMIGEPELKMMKENAILINCSRGKLVDNKALYTALTEGWIAFAGMDDSEEEPAKLFNWTPDLNPLFQLDNCFITPHVAYYSEESLIEARTIAARNVRAVLTGNDPPNRVQV